MEEAKSSKSAIVVPTLIKVGVPLIAVGVGYLLVRKMLKGKTNPDGTSSSIAPTLENTKIERHKLTISVSDATLFANTLYGAMMNFGTDEKAIYSIFNNISTKDDMLLVIKTFGMKQYLIGTRAAFLGQSMNLIGWLRAELSSKEISKLKPKFDSWGIPI